MKNYFFFFLLSIFLSSCSQEVSEKDEFKKLTEDSNEWIKRARDFEINYFQHAEQGRINIETLKDNVEKQIVSCEKTSSYLRNISYIHENNQRILRAFTGAVETDCKLRKYALIISTSTNEIERLEAEKKGEKYLKLKKELFDNFKENFSNSCLKFECGKYLKVQ